MHIMSAEKLAQLEANAKLQLEAVRIYTPGLIAAGTILVFCAQRQLMTADSNIILVGGLMLTLFIFEAYGLILFKGALFPSKFVKTELTICLLSLLLGSALILAGLKQGQSRLSANERRCTVIQHDMLADLSRRQDDAAMLQALGCRPQGDEMPSYPAAPAPRLPYAVLQ